MNFGATHLGQTSALLRKDSKRLSSGVLTLHAAPKNLYEGCHFDIHSSPRSEASASPWDEGMEAFKLVPSLLERDQFRQYDSAAGSIIQELKESLDLAAEGRARCKDLTDSFTRFLESYKGSTNSRRASFSLIKEVIEAVSSIMCSLMAGAANSDFPDFREEQAVKLMGAFASLQRERELLSA